MPQQESPNKISLDGLNVITTKPSTQKVITSLFDLVGVEKSTPVTGIRSHLMGISDTNEDTFTDFDSLEAHGMKLHQHMKPTVELLVENLAHRLEGCNMDVIEQVGCELRHSLGKAVDLSLCECLESAVNLPNFADFQPSSISTWPSSTTEINTWIDTLCRCITGNVD